MATPGDSGLDDVGAGERERLRAFLAHVPLFQGAPLDALDQVLPRFVAREAPAGAVVVEQGGPGDELFLVETGELAVTARVGGAPVRLGTLRPGDLFGEMALLRDAPRTATVTALTSARLWTLSRAAFDDAVARAPALGQRLRAIMRRRELANALRALQ